MRENKNPAKSLAAVIKSRSTIRSFTAETPCVEDMHEIILSAVFAPYGGAAGIPLSEIRKIFVFSRNTEPMEKAREMLFSQMKKNARKLRILLMLLPFLRKKMRPFSNRLNDLSKNGIPSLNEAAHFIIVAEKKRVPPGFPPIEKQSIAHALQNMWLTATSLGLGFQLISEAGSLSSSKQFLKLLGLPRGNYAIDGCVIGFPKKYPETNKERNQYNINDYAAWI